MTMMIVISQQIIAALIVSFLATIFSLLFYRVLRSKTWSGEVLNQPRAFLSTNLLAYFILTMLGWFFVFTIIYFQEPTFLSDEMVIALSLTAPFFQWWWNKKNDD